MKHSVNYQDLGLLFQLKKKIKVCVWLFLQPLLSRQSDTRFSIRNEPSLSSEIHNLEYIDI